MHVLFNPVEQVGFRTCAVLSLEITLPGLTFKGVFWGIFGFGSSQFLHEVMLWCIDVHW